MRRALPLMLLAFALAACAEKPIVDPPPGAQATYQADDVVLRVEQIGGFVPVERLVTYLPELTVYGDGRVLTQGPVPASYPGPALPNVQVQTITPEALRTLVEQAVAANLGVPADFGQPPVADGTSTRITVLTSAGPQVSTVYMLGMDDGLTPAQVAARAPLRSLVKTLEELPGTLGQSRPYVPDVLAAVTSTWLPDPALTEPEQAWPGPALPGQKVGAPGGNLGCVTVSGPQLAPVLDAATHANQLTPWVWDATRYRVQFRPLLPDESSCDDLGQH